MRSLGSPSARSLMRRDLPLALVVAVLLEVGFMVSLTDDDDEVLAPPNSAGRLVLTAGALSLVFRRIVPVTVFVINGTADLVYEGLDFRPTPLPLGVLIALYTVAVTRRPLVAGVCTACYVTGLLGASLEGMTMIDDDQVYVNLVSVAGTAMVGYGVALGRLRATLAEQHAAALVREEGSRTRLAVAQEQARIAREVHDMVANEVNVIVAQAAAARRVVDRQPQAAATALESIESVGRDALDGLRHLLTVVRTEHAPADRPSPGLNRLPWLLDQVERAGLPVEFAVRGSPRPLPPEVEREAFRIVQEALTNSLKHAGPTCATVTLDYGDEFLGVDVHDHGSAGPPTSRPGYGLISMRQRAELLGGHLCAGPDAERGFRVTAHLPVVDTHEPVKDGLP
jgi:signal transduction histidine kinase